MHTIANDSGTIFVKLQHMTSEATHCGTVCLRKFGTVPLIADLSNLRLRKKCQIGTGDLTPIQLQTIYAGENRHQGKLLAFIDSRVEHVLALEQCNVIFRSAAHYQVGLSMENAKPKKEKAVRRQQAVLDLATRPAKALGNSYRIQRNRTTP